MTPAPLLQTHDVVRSFGSLLAVNRVSLTLKEGELRSIIGPNGAGKTTLFRLIAGEMAPSAGRIVFQGRDITGLPRINRRGTAILLVEQTLDVALTLSHRLYVMDQGRIQFEGTPDALRAEPTVQQRFLGV